MNNFLANYMTLKTIKVLLISIFCLSYMQVASQDEYRAELGVSTGLSYYIGDLNSIPLNNMQGAFGGFGRYKLNNRVAFRGELNTTQVVVSIPTKPNYGHWVTSGEVCGEFNFFDLEKSQYKRDSRTFSPFISGGLGLMIDVYSGQTTPEIFLPLGLGCKLILNERWNLNILWAHKLLLPIIKVNGEYHADNLENKPGYNNYYYLNGTNTFNDDLLSTITVGLSMNIWRKECDCRNTAYKKSRLF